MPRHLDWRSTLSCCVFLVLDRCIKLQRSLIELYRTILHQILKSKRGLCRTAFPDWQPKFAASAPSMSILIEAMKNSPTQDVLSTNSRFVTDNLDDYNRDSIGKPQLATLMLYLTRSTRVKILLSSRAEVPIENTFRGVTGICLESLTSPDILAFIHSRLWKYFSATLQVYFAFTGDACVLDLRSRSTNSEATSCRLMWR